MPAKFNDGSIPKGFLDDVLLLPSFYQPETEELRWATHANIVKSMFYTLWRDIKWCEFKRLNSGGTFQLGEIIKDHETWFDKWYTSEETRRGKLI